MPMRIRVNLEPAEPGAVPPAHTGPAVNAALLAAVRDHVSPVLSTTMHDGRGYKPYTITPLLDEQYRPVTRRSLSTWFEVGLLADNLADAAATALRRTSTFRIGRHTYHNVNVGTPITSTYEQLAAESGAIKEWAFKLLTPAGFATAIAEGPRHEIPWPEPERVFTNLVRRWAHFAPHVNLPAALEPTIKTHIEVTNFDLRSAQYLVKKGSRLRRGAIGRITYQLTDVKHVPIEVIMAVNALSRYAEYAGLADRTAMGMGYVRRVREHDQSPES